MKIWKLKLGYCGVFKKIRVKLELWNIEKPLMGTWHVTAPYPLNFFLFLFSFFFSWLSSPMTLSLLPPSLSQGLTRTTSSFHRPAPRTNQRSSEDTETLGPSSLTAQMLVFGWSMTCWEGWSEGATTFSGRFLIANLDGFVFSTSFSSKWCLHFPTKVTRSLAHIFVQIKTLQVDPSQPELYFELTILNSYSWWKILSNDI